MEEWTGFALERFISILMSAEDVIVYKNQDTVTFSVALPGARPGQIQLRYVQNAAGEKKKLFIYAIVRDGGGKKAATFEIDFDYHEIYGATKHIVYNEKQWLFRPYKETMHSGLKGVYTLYENGELFVVVNKGTKEKHFGMIPYNLYLKNDSDRAEWTAAERAVGVLNRALQKDPKAVRELFDVRAECNNPKLFEDETIQVSGYPYDGEKAFVSMLGIINGIFGTRKDYWSLIVANYNENNEITSFSLNESDLVKGT